MKKICYIKETLLQITFLSAFFLIAACGNMQKQDDPKEVAEEQNESNFDNNKQEKDAEFMVNAAGISLKEIQLGQLAQQKGISSDVRKLGKMMEDAHTQTLRDLNALATSKSIVIPTSLTDDANDAHRKLNEKEADDFDKAYADMVVDGHKEAINTFEQASTACNDTEIRNWASSSLPALRQHLQHSEACQQKTRNM